jgi:hypothetical protein
MGIKCLQPERIAEPKQQQRPDPQLQSHAQVARLPRGFRAPADQAQGAEQLTGEQDRAHGQRRIGQFRRLRVDQQAQQQRRCHRQRLGPVLPERVAGRLEGPQLDMFLIGRVAEKSRDAHPARNPDGWDIDTWAREALTAKAS